MIFQNGFEVFINPSVLRAYRKCGISKRALYNPGRRKTVGECMSSYYTLQNGKKKKNVYDRTIRFS